jgi:hypothetical protein
MSKSKSKRLTEENTEQMLSELSSSAFFQSTSTQVDKPTKPQVEKYTTHLTPETIKAVKRYAFEHDMKDYEVVQQALDLFLKEKSGGTDAPG